MTYGAIGVGELDLLCVGGIAVHKQDRGLGLCVSEIVKI